MLVGAEGAGLFEQTIYQSRFAMINVGDDGDVADVLHIVNVRNNHVAQYTRRDQAARTGKRRNGRVAYNGDLRRKVKLCAGKK
jgi:hypothetical protein